MTSDELLSKAMDRIRELEAELQSWRETKPKQCRDERLYREMWQQRYKRKT